MNSEDISNDTMTLENIFLKRRSSRSFDLNRIVPERFTTAILKAAQWTPSSRNLQPWKFMVFDHQTPDELNIARHLISEGNRVWAHNANLLILASTLVQKEDGTTYQIGMHGWI